MTTAKQVLLLGAGLVARPLVRYLLEQGCALTVASRTVAKAEKLLAGHPRGTALAVNSDNDQALAKLIAPTDLAVSLLPATQHVAVAKICVAHKKHLVTTSYVKPEMQALDGPARQAGVLLLNEIGLDPGLDHMSAMRVIRGVTDKNGKVVSFRSYCGGLPAPEDNNNPWGYKFSWSPRGVVAAGKNEARYLKEGQEVFIPGPELFGHFWTMKIGGLPTLEAYPNRDSLGYVALYGLHGIKTMYRGTLRYEGHCRTWKAMADLGLFDETALDWRDGAYADLVCHLAQAPRGAAAKKAVMEKFRLGEKDEPIRRLEWLGLFSQEKIPQPGLAPLDILANRLQEKLQYAPGERDLIVLHHEFEAEFKDGRREFITSTLIEKGQPGGDSAMARTVALPAAIAVRLILEQKIALRGVAIPVQPEIYGPVLEELARLGVNCKEESRPL